MLKFSIALVVVTAAASIQAQGFTVDDSGSQIAISENGQPVLSYRYKSADSAETGAGPGHFHPIHGLFGEVLTSEHPVNPLRTPGISWNWARLGAKGQVIDLERGVGGRRAFERVLNADAAQRGASVSLQNVWLAGEPGEAQVIETLSFIVNAVEDGQRKIDIYVNLRSVATDLIYVTGSVPGAGLCLSLSPERQDWQFVGNTELQPSSLERHSAPYLVCSYRDALRSSRSAMAIFHDARNPGFAQPGWLLETPERVWAGVPETVKAELAPGEFLEFRYRLVLAPMSGQAGDFARAYAQFMAEGQRRE